MIYSTVETEKTRSLKRQSNLNQDLVLLYPHMTLTAHTDVPLSVYIQHGEHFTRNISFNTGYQPYYAVVIIPFTPVKKT